MANQILKVVNGVLMYETYTVWHSGNLTKLSQLDNDTGYITSAALTDYLPLSAGSTKPLTGALYSRVIVWNTLDGITASSSGILDGNNRGIVLADNSTTYFGRGGLSTMIRSSDSDLIHQRGSTNYSIWDKKMFTDDDNSMIGQMQVYDERQTYTRYYGTTQFGTIIEKPSTLKDKTIAGFFSMTNMPSSSWHSGFIVKGWNTNYAAWQLVSQASTVVGDSLYFRSGAGDTWGEWKKLAFVSDVESHDPLRVGDGTNFLYAELNNEINFGGTNNSGDIRFGYKSKDSKPVPSTYIFGNSDNGTATLKAAKFMTAGGTSSQFVKGDGSLDSVAYLPLIGTSANAMTGRLYTPGITITSTTAASHLEFSRTDYNYIRAGAAGGVLAFVTNGNAIGSVGTTLLISHNNRVQIGSGVLPTHTLTVTGNAKISDLLTASNGLQLGDTADFGWYKKTDSDRIVAGNNWTIDKNYGISVNDLLVSNVYSDYTLVPSRGILSRGVIYSMAGFMFQENQTIDMNVLPSDSTNNTWKIHRFDATTTNYPGTDVSSTSKVTKGVAMSFFPSNLGYQIAFDDNAEGIAFRKFSPGSASTTNTWKFLATTEMLKTSVGNYLPLAGGTMKGSIEFDTAQTYRVIGNNQSATFVSKKTDGTLVSIGYVDSSNVLQFGKVINQTSYTPVQIGQTTFNGAVYIDANILRVNAPRPNGNGIGSVGLTSARYLNGYIDNMYGSAQYLMSNTIPLNSDLNDYKTPGFFRCGNDTIAASLSNSPTTHSFSLIIEANVGESSAIGFKQTLTTHMTDNTSMIMYRNYHNGTWGNWITFYTTNNISSAVAGQATKLATARTLTVGLTGKSFNGTANVSWTLAEIGAIAKASDSDIGTLKFKDATSNLNASGIYDANSKSLLSYTGTDTYVSKTEGTTYIRSGSTNLIHKRNSTNYMLYDEYNLPSKYLIQRASIAPTKNGWIRVCYAGYMSLQGMLMVTNTYSSGAPKGLTISFNGTYGSKSLDGFADVTQLSGSNSYFDKARIVRANDYSASPNTSRNYLELHYTGISTNNTLYLTLVSGYNIMLDISEVDDDIPSDMFVDEFVLYKKGMGSQRVSANKFSFPRVEWTDTGNIDKTDEAMIQVLNGSNANDSAAPSTLGTVLQVNSRAGHWNTQLWIDQTNTSSVGKIRYRTLGGYDSTTWQAWKILATEDWVTNQITTTTGNYLPLSAGSTKQLQSTLYFNGLNGYGINIDLKTIAQGWSRGMVFSHNGTNIAYIGVYGKSGTTSYAYISATGTYSDTKNLRVYPSGNVTMGGTVTAPTFVGALTGNASTATKLATARTINGTSFDGSANITTSTWGTARTITIGSTGKSVNGSAAVSWSLAEIGAAAASHTHSYLPLSGGTLTGQLTANELIVAKKGVQIGSTTDIGWYADGARISAGINTLRAVNIGSLLISNQISDYTKVPTNGAWVKGAGYFYGGQQVMTKLADSSTVDNYNHDLGGWRNTTQTVTGVLCVKLPYGFISTMANYKLSVYCYKSQQSTDISLFGYNYSGSGGSWNNLSLIQHGYPYNVRVGYKGSNCYILIGDNGTAWSYPQVWVTDILTGYSYNTRLTSGCSVEVSTDVETEYTSIVTPTPNPYNYATKLKTARTINGTSFDGSANITTSSWGTARNITIGSSTKSVNGSAAVAYTLSEIGAMTIGSSGYGTAYMRVTTVNGTGWNMLGSSSGATFTIFAPTTAGSAGQLLTSAGAGKAPTWTTLADISIGSASQADKLTFEKIADINTGTIGRFFTSTSAAPTNAPSSAWTDGLTLAPNNDVQHKTQIAFCGLSNSVDLYIRSMYNAAWGTWRKLLTDANYTSYTVTKTGTGASGTWGIGITGNAATATTATNATKLSTPRTINGTSFDGSANITTANWGTTRTLTIGSTGKSVNGGANISWSLSEIGAAAATHTHSYLPLAGGTMTGTINARLIRWNTLDGTTASTSGIVDGNNAGIVLADASNVYFGRTTTVTKIRSAANNLLHNRAGTDYTIWDSYNLNTALVPKRTSFKPTRNGWVRFVISPYYSYLMGTLEVNNDYNSGAPRGVTVSFHSGYAGNGSSVVQISGQNTWWTKARIVTGTSNSDPANYAYLDLYYNGASTNNTHYITMYGGYSITLQVSEVDEALGTNFTSMEFPFGAEGVTATNVTANTLLSGKTIKITSNDGANHLAFSRPNLNYITAPTSGYFGFATNGKSISQANCDLVINSNMVFPGTTNVVSLGTSSYKWSNVYATTFIGALSGNATTASKLATARTITFTGGATGSGSFDGSANVSIALSVASHTHTLAQISDLGSTWDAFLKAGCYERKMIFNGTTYPVLTDVSGASDVKWYAPASAGTSGYVCTSTGAVPTWTAQSALNVLSATKLTTARTINGVSFNGTANITFNSLYPSAIAANTDLNTITQSGMYYCAANVTVATLTNCPTTNAFSLLVERHAGTKQTLTTYTTSSSSMWYRNYYNGTWGAWKVVYTTDNIPSSLKNPYALTISLNGTSQGAYDGSAAKSINITASSVGAAASSHTHDYLPLTGGTLSGKLIAKGGINLNNIGKTGISFYTTAYVTWVEYLTTAGAGNASTGGSASTYGNVTSWARRSTIESSSGYGWIWDSCANTANANPDPKMALSANNGNLYVKGTVTAPTFSGALTGNATTATTATKLGSTTIGSTSRGIYLSGGTPTALSATVGSATTPVYMSSGTITAVTSLTKALVLSGLNVSGTNTITQYCDFTAGAGNSGSDIRFKRDVKPMHDVLDDIRDVKIITYEWNKDGERSRHTMGVIAQQIMKKKSFERLVHSRDDADKTLWVEYDRIGVIALKGLQEEVKIREEQNQRLEDRINKTVSEIDKLKSENDKMKKMMSILCDKMNISIDDMTL